MVIPVSREKKPFPFLPMRSGGEKRRVSLWSIFAHWKAYARSFSQLVRISFGENSRHSRECVRALRGQVFVAVREIRSLEKYSSSGGDDDHGASNSSVAIIPSSMIAGNVDTYSLLFPIGRRPIIATILSVSRDECAA